MENKKSQIKSIIDKSFDVFDYYRRGPVSLLGLSPGLLFQSCVNHTLKQQLIPFVEDGLADHVIHHLSTAIQLKTTSRENHDDSIILCRSSMSDPDPSIQKLGRVMDVQNRVLSLRTKYNIDDFLLVHVDLTKNETRLFSLWKSPMGFVGDWIEPSNVVSPKANTHVYVKLRHMVEI